MLVDFRELRLLKSDFWFFSPKDTKKNGIAFYLAFSCLNKTIETSCRCCTVAVLLMINGLSLTCSRFSTYWRSMFTLFDNSVHQHPHFILKMLPFYFYLHRPFSLPSLAHRNSPKTNLTHDLSLSFYSSYTVVCCRCSLGTLINHILLIIRILQYIFTTFPMAEYLRPV